MLCYSMLEEGVSKSLTLGTWSCEQWSLASDWSIFRMKVSDSTIITIDEAKPIAWSSDVYYDAAVLIIKMF